MGNAYIVDACRTPRGIGKVGKGALAHLTSVLPWFNCAQRNG